MFKSVRMTFALGESGVLGCATAALEPLAVTAGTDLFSALATTIAIPWVRIGTAPFSLICSGSAGVWCFVILSQIVT